MATARVTGLVLESTLREGLAVKTGQPYAFTEVRVLCGSDVATFTVNIGGGNPVFAQGDVCDVLVDQRIASGRLRTSHLHAWSDVLLPL